MILRKNISLNEEYLKKLEPLMEKHNGNLSAVIREVIDLADAAFQDPDSVKRLISGLKKEQNLTSWALTWSLKNLKGKLPDEELVSNIIGDDITSISSLKKYLNNLGEEIYWGSSVDIRSDDDKLPKSATFCVTGKNQDMNRFLASVIALFARKKFNLGVSRLKNIDSTIEFEMKMGEHDWASSSIVEHFGYMDSTLTEIHNNPNFWRKIIKLYSKMNYDMAVVSRQFFEDMMAGSTTPKLATYIEKFYGFPINQIPQDELFTKMNDLYKPMGIIENMDLNKDSLIIQHGLTDPDAIEKLNEVFLDLLELTGQTYVPEVGENLIVYKHQSEVGKILIKMLDNFKDQEISFENFHSLLSKMLDVLKSVPYDDEFIKFVGKKFGEMVIQIYEKEKMVDNWDAELFLSFLQEANIILTQDVNWRIISDNIIHGRINTCPLVKENGNPDATNCKIIKEIFNEWVSHAFGEEQEKIHESHTESPGKSNFCEIYVAL